MLADEVKHRIEQAIKGTEFEGIAAEVTVETPKVREFGHYATNLPFLLKKDLKRPPMEIAEKMAALLSSGGFFASVEAAKPGFVNFRISPEALRAQVKAIRAAGDDYGRSDSGAGHRVQVEFVSANPTGPLSVGHGRLAAFGDALASVMSAAGYDAQREFYVNDVGNQIARLAASVEKRVLQLLGKDAPMAEDDYQGEYLIPAAQAILDKHGPGILDKEEAERRSVFAEETITAMLAEQKAALESFGVKFDVWFREKQLHEAGALGQALEVLQAAGHVYDKEDAVWFASSAFSDNEDRVLRKGSGLHTYFMSDIAYIRNKFERGFETLIYIWGADHHGYIERMKSAAKALGHDPAALEILIIQLVRFKQGEEYVRMSKRKGNLITLTDLIEEIGSDMARFFFLMRTRDSHLEFDLRLAQDKSEANPLYYLQYAHARICTMIEKAVAVGLKPDDAALDRLELPKELELIKTLADFPWEIRNAAVSREPHRLIAYLTDLAGEFHSFYHDHRVIQESEPGLSAARLALCDAVRIVFCNTLGLLGLSAPEKM